MTLDAIPPYPEGPRATPQHRIGLTPSAKTSRALDANVGRSLVDDGAADGPGPQVQASASTTPTKIRPTTRTDEITIMSVRLRVIISGPPGIGSSSPLP